MQSSKLVSSGLLVAGTTWLKEYFMTYHARKRLLSAMLKFQRFNPADCQFPPPRVPLLPALRWRDLALNNVNTVNQSVLAGPGVRHFSRGRYALHAAYEAAGVGDAGALLAPAYHCRTMLDPALALKGNILLYALNSDLTPQMESIKMLVGHSKPRVRALVVPHYFGFAQPEALITELVAFCSVSGITLIEDGSHAWQVVTERALSCQANSGHVLIGSPYKFFACEDGGTLWGNQAEFSAVKTLAPSLLEELKSLKQTLARSWRSHRVSQLVFPAEQMAMQNIHLGEQIIEKSCSPSEMFDSRSENNSSLALSRWVMRHTEVSRVVQQRQHNYRQWMRAVGGLRGAKALFADLPPHCAPYMFALHIAQPEQHFYQLKHLGVPIWRWDDMAVSDCPIATQYRLHLLHLPCHQSLTQEQMQWMTEAITRVLA